MSGSSIVFFVESGVTSCPVSTCLYHCSFEHTTSYPKGLFVCITSDIFPGIRLFFPGRQYLTELIAKRGEHRAVHYKCSDIFRIDSRNVTFFVKSWDILIKSDDKLVFLSVRDDRKLIRVDYFVLHEKSLLLLRYNKYTILRS